MISVSNGNMIQMSDVEIDLASFGTSLGPRVVGQEICQKVLNDLQDAPGARIHFILEKIESLSSGFCFDLFGRLDQELGEGFLKRTKFSFGENPKTQILKNLISRSIIEHRNVRTSKSGSR